MLINLNQKIAQRLQVVSILFFDELRICVPHP